MVDFHTDSMDNIASIDVELKVVNIKTKDGKEVKFYLEDYKNYKEKKAIKEEFIRLQKIINIE